MTHKTVSVLLVEDDSVDRMAVQRAFKTARIGNEIFTAKDGVEGLEVLRAGKVPEPFIILLDLNMPRMNGVEFLQELRKDEKLHRSVVFVLTTSREEEDRTKAYDLNVAGYIVKSDVGNGFLKLVEMLDCYWKIVEFP